MQCSCEEEQAVLSEMESHQRVEARSSGQNFTFILSKCRFFVNTNFAFMYDLICMQSVDLTPRAWGNCPNHISFVSNEVWNFNQRIKTFSTSIGFQNWGPTLWWSLKAFENISGLKRVMNVLRTGTRYVPAAEPRNFEWFHFMSTWELRCKAKFQEITFTKQSIFISCFVEMAWP